MPRRRKVRDIRHIAGKAYTNHLEEIIIQVGEYTFTRDEMICDLKNGNYRAGRSLTRYMKRFGTSTVSKLARKIDPDTLGMGDGIGTFSVCLWLKILDYHGINSESWWNRTTKVATVTQKKRRKKRKKR
jgi:hypothetical protein